MFFGGGRRKGHGFTVAAREKNKEDGVKKYREKGERWKREKQKQANEHSVGSEGEYNKQNFKWVWKWEGGHSSV